MSFPVLPEASSIDAAADPAVYVIQSCERAKVWLAQALASNHIEAIVETKAQAEAIRVYTMQKQLGKDAELSACEIVRRAERCIGLAIRRGQQEGRIARTGDIGSLPRCGIRGGERGVSRGVDLDRPAQYVESACVLTSHYAMADGVTDEHFDAALDEAKAEGNLSRSNIVRKVKAKKPLNGESIWSRLEELIAEGHSSDQIAREIGVGRDAVTRRAKALGLIITADAIMGRSKRLNHERMLREFVATLESLTPSCDLIDTAKVNAAARAECVEIMDEAMRALAKFQRRLRREVEA